MGLWPTEKNETPVFLSPLGLRVLCGRPSAPHAILAFARVPALVHMLRSGVSTERSRRDGGATAQPNAIQCFPLKRVTSGQLPA
jgi:hypothetical protein